MHFGETESEVLETIYNLINGNNDPGGKPLNLEFIVDSSSNIKKIDGSNDMRVFIKGCFEFCPQLTLNVDGCGIIDYESTKNDVLRREDYYSFRRYELELTVETSREDYLGALEKFRFLQFSEARFSNGKLKIGRKDGYANMFSQIKELKQIAVVFYFDVASSADLSRYESQLRDHVDNLGLKSGKLEYDSYFMGSSDDSGENFSYYPVVEAGYIFPSTGLGLEILFYPAEVRDFQCKRFKHKYSVVVPDGSIKEKHKREYSKTFGFPDIDGQTTEDLILGELDKHYLTRDGKVYYVSYDKEEFLKSLVRWQHFLYKLKHGKPEEAVSPEELPPSRVLGDYLLKVT